MVSERNHAPRLLTRGPQLDAATEPYFELSPEGREQATAQAIFEKVVYEELDTPFRYRSVAVLLVHWAAYLDEQLGCGPEVKEVKTLFEEKFHFKCETLTLDDKTKPQLQLNSRVTRFIHDHNGDCRTHLLILYYTGHGDHQSDEDGLHIRGKIGPTYEARAKWKPIEEHFAEADADVLTILDTCSAGSAVKGSTEDTKVYEVLAAAGRGTATAAPGSKSFTRAMIDSLNEHVRQFEHVPLTTHDLNQAIMRQRRVQKSILFPRSGHTQRFVKLAPLDKGLSLRRQSLPKASMSLTLRFVFSDATSLSDEQASRLAMALSRSITDTDFERDTSLQPTAIDWVDFRSVAGDSGSADAARLQHVVKRVQRKWRHAAKAALRAEQNGLGQKHELEEDHGVSATQGKRRCVPEG